MSLKEADPTSNKLRFAFIDENYDTQLEYLGDIPGDYIAMARIGKRRLAIVSKQSSNHLAKVFKFSISPLTFPEGGTPQNSISLNYGEEIWEARGVFGAQNIFAVMEAKVSDNDKRRIYHWKFDAEDLEFEEVSGADLSNRGLDQADKRETSQIYTDLQNGFKYHYTKNFDMFEMEADNSDLQDSETVGSKCFSLFCQTCVNGDNTQCQVCETGLSGPNCLTFDPYTCDSSCEACASNDFCASCPVGEFSVLDSSNKITKCVSTCELGYKTDNIRKECKNCQDLDPNCSDCSYNTIEADYSCSACLDNRTPGDSCGSCILGYRLNSGSTCEQCSVSGCKFLILFF